jgi:hypothetical protein
MRPKVWLSILVVLVLLPYLLLSLLVERPLSPASLLLYPQVAARSATGTTGTEGNLRTRLRALSAAEHQPQAEARLEFDGSVQALPLPPSTAPLGPGTPDARTFLTLADGAQLERYLAEAIPARGWTLRDRTAGRHSFLGHGALLGVSVRPYAGRARTLTLSLSPAPPGR